MMGRQGFVDANGYEVTIGAYVEYQDKRFAKVTDLTQDGDVSIRFLDGEHLQTKWRMVARLPADIVRQLDAMETRLRSNPAGKIEGYTPQPAIKKMISLPRVCPPDFQPQWSEDAGIVTGEYQGMKMAASTSWPHAREAIRQSLWMSAELYRLGQVPKSASEK